MQHRVLAAARARAQVHQFDFCAAGGASGEANNEAVLNLAGVRPGHLLMAEWHNSVGRPCHYVAADLANGCLVLAIRSAAGCRMYHSMHRRETKTSLLEEMLRAGSACS